MEILSPASNMDHIKVAIDGKSNAVYGGVKKWNARNKAINFSNDEYNEAIELLHKNGIKFYLTLNILMLDEEIKEVIEFLKNNALPDAFIVADLGLALELKKNFSDVPLHFSTQFGAHNVDDVNYIETLGGERAILARELTMDELKNIRRKTNIELECFVWGSQCLSFSGLCFFGTLINGGGGNRGKCIITCRDIYSINKNKGHYLYVPDMDCLNLISKLDGIDCIKLEGRRRKPKEILKILNQIANKETSSESKGYLLGKEIRENHLYEKINSRADYYKKASDIANINSNDVCIRYENNKPVAFSDDYSNPNVKYIYTEIKKDYNINKKNISLDLEVENNFINKVLYLNYRGEGHTFIEEGEKFIELTIDDFIKEIELNNDEINIYKVKYVRDNSQELKIDEKLKDDIINYIKRDCNIKNKNVRRKSFKINKLYVETNNIDYVRQLICDEYIKIIYNIETVKNLKNIKKIVNEFDDKIIYKLPLFNWQSEDLDKYYNMLNNKEVMFTRLTQIDLCKKINIKKKIADYTLYTWNKKTLKYLIDNGFTDFTCSPELSYERNKLIFGENNMQCIIGGKLPLVYSRNCFKHLYGCTNCQNEQCNRKQIKNEDKNLEFDIVCNDDYRVIYNKEPFLNDYLKTNITKNTQFRYVTYGQNLSDIKKSITAFKTHDYYNDLINKSLWKNSYECNLFEGRE